MGKTYDDIRLGAVTFANAAHTLDIICKAGVEYKENKIGEKLFSQHVIPQITLMAFSCELALKSLMSKNKKSFKSIHNLSKLYKLIANNDKFHISRRVIEKMKNYNSDYDNQCFLDNLEETANTFVDWRYFYEKPVKVVYPFLKSLFDVLIDYVKLSV